MAKFAYNNTKNTNTSHILFELNYGYYSQVSFKDNVDSYSRFCFADELVEKLRELIDICQQNLFHTQELQKEQIIKA